MDGGHRPGTVTLFCSASHFTYRYDSQPIQAFEHPKFRELIDVTSRAKHGVSIPSRKSTRQQILHLFKGYLTRLRAELRVSITPTIVKSLILHLQGPTVQGEISLTCDAWQASNTDGYFAVTAHWIQASTPTTWVLSSALIGFTRLNNAHVGVRLGQTLFKVVKRLGIEKKVCHNISHIIVITHNYQIGHVTCDNASNNITMMKEFAARLENATGKVYKWKKRKIK